MQTLLALSLFFLLACASNPAKFSQTAQAPLARARHPTESTDPKPSCSINKTSIDELFRIMLGRDATDTEACHYADLMKGGLQVAYFEPYSSYQEKMPCGWISTSPDVNEQGIPYSEFKDWTERFGTGPDGNPSFPVSAIFRTLFGTIPDWGQSADLSDPHSLGFWVTKLRQFAAQDRNGAFQKLSLLMQQTLPNEIHLDATLVTYIFRRQLNRDPILSRCTLGMSSPPVVGSDCYFLNGLATGSITILDIVHFVRSTTEYIRRNINPTCYTKVEALPDALMVSVDIDHPSKLANQHGIGESISELYRVFLSRYPTKDELRPCVQSYPGGETRSFLKNVAETLLSVDGQNANFKPNENCKPKP